MKISFFAHQRLVNPAKFVWKTLVILILSILLIAPRPALALDYYSPIQSYVSEVKVDLDEVVTSIEKLPSLSYENGKISLAKIDSKLEKMKSDASKNASYFQKLSDESQQEYQKNLDKINRNQQLSNYAQNYAQNNQVWAFHYQITIAALQESNKKLSNTITLTSKISKLCDDLERRINLATQKFGNVKEYADALNSFNDPDVLTEITELNTLLADLTKNLATAA
jgi:hypothetical protein